MKRSALFLLSLLALSGARAAEVAPTPEETLKIAEKGRVEFIRVLVDLQRFIPKMTSSAEVYPYLTILDPLAKLGAKYSVDQLGGTPLEDFGGVITLSVTKWIRFDADDEAIVSLFLQWATNPTRSTAAQQQGRFLFAEKDKKALLRWHERILFALAKVRALKADPAVVQEYEQLQGFVVRALLEQRKDLTTEEKNLLVVQTKSSTALQDVAQFLQQEALATRDPLYLKQMVVWAVALGANVRDLSQVVPVALSLAPGDILVESITKLLSADQSPDVSTVRDSIKTMQPGHVSTLAGLLVQLYQGKPIKEANLDYLWELADGLVRRLATMGVPEKVKDLDKLLQRLSIWRLLRRGDFEGSYRVTGDVEGVLTLANLGATNFIGCLTTSKNNKGRGVVSLSFSLFHFAYNFRDQTYEAHHFAVDAPDYIPPHLETYFIKFKIDPAPEAGPPLPVSLRGTFTSGGRFSQFKAERFEGYPAFPQNDPDGAMDSISGVYEATDAKALLTQFTVTQVGQRIAGQMCFLNQTACVPLTFGHFDPGRNVVYATSGELAGGRWVQARAQLREKGKVAEVAYLIGGRGLHTTMKMRLVDTPKIPEVK